MGPGGNVRIDVERSLLQSADEAAAAIRALLSERKIYALNLISSPGSGKTTLIEALLARFEGKGRIAVVEGDIETEIDAERIRKHGVQVRQINTRSSCHIQPSRLLSVLREMDLSETRLLLVENVGNLVCPAEVSPARDHEDGPVAVRDIRRRPRPTRRPRRQPRGGDLRGLRDHRCGDVRPPRPDRGAAGGEEVSVPLHL
jgi:hydrogenase nickel incorporation protein HypB